MYSASGIDPAQYEDFGLGTMSNHTEVNPTTPQLPGKATGASINPEQQSEDGWTVVKEQLVHVDIAGLYQDNVLKGCATASEDSGDLKFQLTGLETKEPILQIGRQVFAGSYSDSAETSVFFGCTAAVSNPNEEDEVFSRAKPRLSAKFECKTKKRLSFKRVFLQPLASS